MRLIDADELYARLKKRYYMHNIKNDRFDMVAREIIKSCMEAVERSKTITDDKLPNKPLTLDELRGMDGEPVFVTKNGESIGYALIYSPCSIVYITCVTGSKWDAEDLIDEGCKFYRRKPEEGMKYG